ncbi:MAG: dTDP-4-amino-4,6-dideoxygalactose transaminase [Pseudomonadota bacterium]
MIPFNKPYMSGRELENISAAHDAGALSGDGAFSRQCETWLSDQIGCRRTLLTHSCTAALEMSALLLDLQPDDEVIMPSYTFVSTANAFALRGARPVFVDIRADTLNLDETLIEAAITPRTRAICAVHYAGVGCEMDAINAIAARRGLSVIEDAAQAICASYKTKPLGGFGRFGAMSFHETKNATCGEGGALFLNEAEDVERAEILREKGTDRSRFLRGAVDKYTWRSLGSSFLLGELSAAFLAAQLEATRETTRRRLDCWDRYHSGLEALEREGLLRRPIVPSHCEHNGHMYYVLLSPDLDRHAVIERLTERGVNAVFHYTPLHASQAGRRLGRVSGAMTQTDAVSASILRLPMWRDLTPAMIEQVVNALRSAVTGQT